jgi:hypothetical protein
MTPGPWAGTERQRRQPRVVLNLNVVSELVF